MAVACSITSQFPLRIILNKPCLVELVQDGIHMPFENVLDYESFTMRVAENDIHNLISLLRVLITIIM